ncbi:MAG: hypothetical protein AKCLJLPJ_01794 [Fimbriimonadales bacterium]|nr:MAG: hypothetical protein EDM73_10510 [Armatimonadota bacterium]MBV6503709.1 hypothetical protein [Fimbriimonadales bacterium]MCE7899467.1 hypothetical protein [Armatimonadetes bacterium ATM1]MDL1929182.1 hypothetical protein [Fimbriimonadia bacterium ATM]MBC6970602.1 hypothetical protein [Armatimonadota bacterium]
MRVLLLKFCDYACRVDGAKGSVIGMFDTIGGPEFPLTHPTFFITAEFEFEPYESGSTAEVKMILIDEDGKQLMGVEGEFVIPRSIEGRPVTLFEMFRIDGLTFPRPGHYRLDVIYNGEPIAEARLALIQGPHPAGPPR